LVHLPVDRCAWFALGLSLLLLPTAADAEPTAASAAVSSSESRGTLAGGGQAFGLWGGWGDGFGIGSGRDTDLEEVEFSAFLPRWMLGLSRPIGQDRWYAGTGALAVEGVLLWQHEPRSGVASGLTLLAHYEFKRRGRLVPFAELGVGFLLVDFDLDRQDDGLNFTPQIGVGLHWFVSKRAALTGAWRFHHISNAGLRDPNHGVNDSLVSFGITYFPGR
jgi:opacity protein-like surface antigen